MQYVREQEHQLSLPTIPIAIKYWMAPWIQEQEIHLFQQFGTGHRRRSTDKILKNLPAL